LAATGFDKFLPAGDAGLIAQGQDVVVNSLPGSGQPGRGFGDVTEFDEVVNDASGSGI
jgi:hypothetical protein